MSELHLDKMVRVCWREALMKRETQLWKTEGVFWGGGSARYMQN